MSKTNPAHPLSALTQPIRLSKPFTLTSLAICSSLVLAGCGNDSDNIFAVDEPEKISEATLIDAPVVTKTFTAAELKAAVATAGLSAAVDADPICGITVQYINHTTKGLKGEATNATGAVILPNNEGNNNKDCQGERPIMLYAHGTTPVQNYNLAALNDPENAAYETALLIAANFAGQGDIVIAPNYPGYDKSELDYAPYVTLQQGQQMLDGLHAGKLAIEKLATNKAAPTKVKASDKLFITGYSQGGYVAMAAAKALDDKGQPATAVSPASGPYALTAFADSIMSGNVIFGGTVFLPMLTRSYDNEYNNLIKGVYADKYAETAPNLFPTNDNLVGLFFAGKIPTTQLFQSSPTGYDILEALPAPTPKNAFGFSDKTYLFNTDFRAKYVQDMQSNPDGIYPAFTAPNGAVPVKSNLAVRKAFIDNDLRAYQPKSPMLLCGGNQDPSVTYDVNADAQARIWKSTAKQPFALIDMDLSNQEARSENDKSTYVTTLPPAVDKNVRAAAMAIQEKFTSNLTTLLTNTYQVAYAEAIEKGKSVAEAQAAGQTASYTEQLSSYHGMVAPYCLSAATVFFDQYR
ncbi:S9 family peptidase [Psychrobacter arenosus]|uniref:alpha/beta hydrolase family protein n=1 Tax=Psychrobacter arenosus TaxID=256326 RepID=UPI001917AA60|nr:alpha/beta fold hydrolase [Psychrobacter arenosus]